MLTKDEMFVRNIASEAGVGHKCCVRTEEATEKNSRCATLHTERKKKRRVNFIPKFHSSLKKFVKYFTMITKRYMYGTKVPNFIGL